MEAADKEFFTDGIPYVTPEIPVLRPGATKIVDVDSQEERVIHQVGNQVAAIIYSGRNLGLKDRRAERELKPSNADHHLRSPR